MDRFDPCTKLVADGPTSHDIKQARRYAAMKFCVCQKSGTDFKTCSRVRLLHSVGLVVPTVETENFCSKKVQGHFLLLERVPEIPLASSQAALPTTER